MLITEALQQLKIVADRIVKRKQLVERHLCHSNALIDPLTSQGGSSKIIASALTSIAALEDRLVHVRVAIQKVNLLHSVTIEGITMTVAEWIIWKRDVASLQIQGMNRLLAIIQEARVKVETGGPKIKVTQGDTVNEKVSLIVYTDEIALAKRAEKSAIILGVLDSRLSVFNATTPLDLDELPEIL